MIAPADMDHCREAIRTATVSEAIAALGECLAQ